MSLEQYKGLVPVAGLVFEAYMSRNDIGSGIRMLLVTQVGRKFVHLFYAPGMHGFRIGYREWTDLYIKPLMSFNSASYKGRVRAKAAQFDRYHMQYSKALIERVLSLTFTCGHNRFNKAHILKAPSKPVTSVKRR